MRPDPTKRPVGEESGEKGEKQGQETILPQGLDSVLPFMATPKGLETFLPSNRKVNRYGETQDTIAPPTDLAETVCPVVKKELLLSIMAKEGVIGTWPQLEDGNFSLSSERKSARDIEGPMPSSPEKVLPPKGKEAPQGLEKIQETLFSGMEKAKALFGFLHSIGEKNGLLLQPDKTGKTVDHAEVPKKVEELPILGTADKESDVWDALLKGISPVQERGLEIPKGIQEIIEEVLIDRIPSPGLSDSVAAGIANEKGRAPAVGGEEFETQKPGLAREQIFLDSNKGGGIPPKVQGMPERMEMDRPRFGEKTIKSIETDQPQQKDNGPSVTVQKASFLEKEGEAQKGFSKPPPVRPGSPGFFSPSPDPLGFENPERAEKQEAGLEIKVKQGARQRSPQEMGKEENLFPFLQKKGPFSLRSLETETKTNQIPEQNEWPGEGGLGEVKEHSLHEPMMKTANGVNNDGITPFNPKEPPGHILLKDLTGGVNRMATGKDPDRNEGQEEHRLPSSLQSAVEQNQTIPFRFDPSNPTRIEPLAWKNGADLPDPAGSKNQEPDIFQYQDMTFPAPEDSPLEKQSTDKWRFQDPLQRSLEKIFSQDQPFSIKQTGSSTMEVVVEPEGMGKMDIELNFSNDRLQGQILVNDQAGKELLERNLPQLLSELAGEGLQVGGFTVSLKNRGHDHQRGEESLDGKGPMTTRSAAESIRSLTGNHRVDILI
ncbi:MAG: flagellar hook-length control protein FliK [Thermodesulfobacteriota bacterium]